MLVGRNTNKEPVGGMRGILNKICELGEVVHVALKNEDKAKVDAVNLTGVVVKVNKSRCQARVAVKAELLKSWYVYHRLGQVTGKGNNVELNGLTDALNGSCGSQ